MTNRPTEPISDEQFQYLLEVEDAWRASLPRMNEREWLAVFPDARAVIPEKIREWKAEQDRLRCRIRDELREIQRRYQDENSRWFWREWLKVEHGPRLVEIQGHIERLRRLLPNSKRSAGTLGPEDIEAARAVPIEDVTDVVFRRRGGTLVGLCPLHTERTPSFTVWLDSNRYHCFGCQESGDVITLIRKLNDWSFRHAVHHLIGTQKT